MYIGAFRGFLQKFSFAAVRHIVAPARAKCATKAANLAQCAAVCATAAQTAVIKSF